MTFSRSNLWTVFYFQPTVVWADCQIVGYSYKEVCPRLASLDCPSIESCPSTITYYQQECSQYVCQVPTTPKTITTNPDLDPAALTTSAPFSSLSPSEDQIPQVIECPNVRYVRTFKFELEWWLVKNYSQCNFCSSPVTCGTNFLIPGPIQCGTYEIEEIPYTMASSTVACVGKSIQKLFIYFYKK